MTCMMENVQEAAESERQAVISAQEMAALPHSAACDSWKKRRNKTYKSGGRAKYK